MRRELVLIYHVRHLQHVIGKPDVDKSCQGRAMLGEAMTVPLQQIICGGRPAWRRNPDTVILRRMLTDAEIV